MDNYFAKLNAVNVKDKTEKKNGLTYLSWAWAWGELRSYTLTQPIPSTKTLTAGSITLTAKRAGSKRA